MGSLNLQILDVGLPQKLRKPFRTSLVASRPNAVVICGLRKGPRGPLWRSRVLSTEAIQAVQALKLAKSEEKLEQVCRSKLARLLKRDLLDALSELQRQNEMDLALEVFKFVRKEAWYVSDVHMYCDMILLLGKNKLIEKAEDLFSELKKEGLKPNTRAFTEMIGAYLRVDMIEKAMETYSSMKSANCAPDKLTFAILIKNLYKVGEQELAAAVKKECYEYLEDAEKFIEEVEKKHSKKRLLSFV